MTIQFIILPFLAGFGALMVRSEAVRRGLLPVVGSVNLLFILLQWNRGIPVPSVNWFALDALSLFFLFVTGLLFALISFSAVEYLKTHPDTGHSLFSREPVFICFMLFFLGTMNAAVLSQHPGIFWVAIEGTTLTSAPLISYHMTGRSLEATWKYLIICSVGIAIALLGYITLTLSLPPLSGAETDRLSFPQLYSLAGELDPFWLKAAFSLMFVGYGTKMGLVPLHTWLPDAHSEAPAPVSALLSGALLNCAFLGILKMLTLLHKAGLGIFGNRLLLVFGILSLFLAGGMILRQKDYKRMLAYSSIEHMGLLALAVGAGAATRYGALLHVLNHSLTKSLLFITAGMILSRRGTKAIDRVQGLITTDPLTALYWVGGSLAIVGLPPFGTFVSELSILKGLGAVHQWALLGLTLTALAIVFMGLFKAVIPMVYGEARVVQDESAADSRSLFEFSPLIMMLMILLLGLWIPGPLQNLLESAAVQLGGYGA